MSPLIALLSACNFVIGMGAFVVIGVVTPISQDFGIPTQAAGLLLTVYALSYAVLSPLLVSLTGGLGRRRVLALGLTLFAFGMALSAAASSLTVLYVARAFAAAGAGLFTPVAATVAAGVSPVETRGRALAAVFFGLTLAQVLGVPVGSWVAYTYGWRLAFWIVLVLAMLGLWLVWHRVPAGLAFRPVGMSDLGHALTDGVIMLAVLFTATFLGAVYVVFTYLSPLLENIMGFGRDGVTLALFMVGVGAVAGNLFGGWLTDRIGPVPSLALLSFGQIVLMPAFSALPFHPALVMVLVALWSACGWSFMAAQQVRLLSLAADKVPVVLALNASAIYIGAALGSALGGLLIAGLGLGFLGAGGGVIALLALAHILASHRQVNLRALGRKP